jgi:hypothetical protein
MRTAITFVIAGLITFGGTDVAVCDCAKILSAAGELSASQVRSGIIGDQFNPREDFGENNSLDPYATSFENSSSCVGALDTNSFTVVGTTKVGSMVGNYNRAVSQLLPKRENFCDINNGLIGLDPLSQQFADYNDDLINPFTNSTGNTAFSGPTNVAPNQWANSMTLSYRSRALPSWRTYDVAGTAGWAGVSAKVSDIYSARLRNLYLSAAGVRTFSCR